MEQRRDGLPPDRRARVRPIVVLTLLVVALAVACSEPAKKKKGRSGDPFDDPFFEEPRGHSMLDDEFFDQPAPRVGPLADRPDDEQPGHFDSVSSERRALERGGYLLDGTGTDRSGSRASRRAKADDADEDAAGEGQDGEDSASSKREKSFSEKAEEATMATMSVLMGLGMAALPYLVGAL